MALTDPAQKSAREIRKHLTPQSRIAMIDGAAAS